MHRKKSKSFKCDTCNILLSTKGCLRRHKEFKHLGVMYSCKICDHKTGDKGSLKRHVQAKHENNEQSKLPCKQCDKQFASQSGLRIHVRSIHKNIWFKCDKCEHKSTVKHDLKRHIKTKHE